MSILLVLSISVLAIAAASGALRVIRPGDLTDRILGLDFFVTVIAAGIFVGAVRRDTPFFLQIAVVVALLAFVATSSVARYIERRGS